ncbi:MAG: hypothetical protein WA981_08140 [Glaciecola sp.]
MSSNSNSPHEGSQQEQQVNQADAQIQAHRAQHQQQTKKLLLIAGAVLIAVLVVVSAYKLITSEPSGNNQNTSPTPIEVSFSQAEIDAFREEFKQALTDYEIRLQPQIDEINFVGYAPAKTGELALLKAQVLEAFAKGAFAEAKNSLSVLFEKAEQLIAQWQADFSSLLQQAQQHFDNENIPQARLTLNKALALMPNNLNALALSSRIDAFGEIQGLLDDLQVAKIERDLPKQIDLLNSIIGLDPKRDGMTQDLSSTQQAYDAQQLEQALAKAEQAINDNDLVSANAFIKKAKTIKPSSKGAQALAAKVATLKANASLNSIKQTITQQQAEDNYRAVQATASKALQRFPNDKVLASALSQANNILKHHSTLDSLLNRAQRIADANVREAASKAMQNAFLDAMNSPSLQAKLLRLGDLIDSYSQPVAVTVNSDAKTYVIVVGVGHVGEHESKIINLTPGKYVLEGTRKGYRAKRVEITVTANTPLSITVVCDEPI